MLDRFSSLHRVRFVAANLPRDLKNQKMKQEIEIYLHGPGTTGETILKLFSDSTVADLIAAAKQAGFAEENLRITIEDEDEPLQKDARLCDCGVKHKHHLHCHVCDKVAVVVHFNGEQKSHKFAPSRPVKRVLKWALDAFGITGVDAENKELRIEGVEGTVLSSQQHIGSYVKPHHCDLELFLTGIVEVQG